MFTICATLRGRALEWVDIARVVGAGFECVRHAGKSRHAPLGRLWRLRHNPAPAPDRGVDRSGNSPSPHAPGRRPFAHCTAVAAPKHVAVLAGPVSRSILEDSRDYFVFNADGAFGPISTIRHGAPFDRCWGLGRHAADIVNVSRLTRSGHGHRDRHLGR